MNQRVLVDVDDVILDYHNAFYNHYGFTKPKDSERFVNFNDHLDIGVDKVMELVDKFNRSPEFSKLETFQNSSEYIRSLVENGFDIIAVTACGNSIETQQHRMSNLEEKFPGAISDVFFVDHNESKEKYLKKFKNSGCVWVEDSVRNYYTGLEVGLDSVLMRTNFNYHEDDEIDEVTNWSEIYQKIISKQ